MLSRKQLGNVYRPQGPKSQVASIILPSGLSPAAGKFRVAPGTIDLSVPLSGFRFVLKLRDVIATANMASVNPLGYLNLISRVLIAGRNNRQGGNATLWDIDLASAALIQATIVRKPFQYNGVGAAGASSAGTEVTDIASPVSGFSNIATGTYDIRIVVDLPAHPFDCAEFLRAGYFLRSQEWDDSLYMQIETAAIASGGTHALGVDGATTTHTLTSYGSGAGGPTLDIYPLPAIMGTDLDGVHVPGFLSRTAVPLSQILQAAGGVNTKLLILDKQDTTRLWALIGTSVSNPAMSAYSDANLTTLGVVVGGNRVVRENVDIFAHRQEQVRHYGTPPIQGVTLLDFMSSRNPQSKYLASDAGTGTTLELRGQVAGVANAYGLIVQESERYMPQGPLYSE